MGIRKDACKFLGLVDRRDKLDCFRFLPQFVEFGSEISYR